jgi:serine/threonine protein kinase
LTINAPDTTQKICLECNRQFTGIVAACPHDGTLLVKLQQDPLIGSVLDGSYEVLSLIGHGGMGVVYKARHKLMDRIVAIKMLKAALVSDSMSVKRFQQEVKATGRLVHPHAITVYDFGISPEGLPYIVMDYLEGSSLSEVIKKDGQVEVDRCIKIVSEACEALAHAHKQGVVHRDLKPSNIVLTNYDDDPDFVKVVDFGVAKLVGGAAEGAQRLTQTGEVCGSPVYMSPEQCLGQELDFRSDIYSMGIVVYETLTGRLPLIGRTMVDTMSKHVSEMPQPFNKIRPDIYIPERLEQVVFRAMAKDPAKRHQSMEELRADLEYAIPKPGRNSSLRSTHASMAAYPPAAEPKGFSRKTAMMIAAIVAAAVAAGIALFAMIHSGAATQQSVGHTASVTAGAKDSLKPERTEVNPPKPANSESSTEPKKDEATRPEVKTESTPAETASEKPSVKTAEKPSEKAAEKVAEEKKPEPVVSKHSSAASVPSVAAKVPKVVHHNKLPATAKPHPAKSSGPYKEQPMNELYKDLMQRSN